MSAVAILGAGIMASALTVPLTRNGHRVHLVGTHLDTEIIDAIQRTGVHPHLGIALPEGVTAFQLEQAREAFAGAEVAISGVNSFGVTWAGQQLSALLRPGMRVLSITKGMDADGAGDLRILPEVLMEQVGAGLAGQVTWSAIVGPSIAGEVAVEHDTAVVFTGTDQESLDALAHMFRTDAYHVWTSTDFLGHEIGAATKNVYAFAAGFMEGLLDAAGEGTGQYRRYNYGAAVFAQGTREMLRFIELLGGDRETTTGLAGVGDLFVTSMGGRNVRAGRYVGSGVPFSEVRDQHMKGVTLEGVAAIEVIGAAIEKLTEREVIEAEEFPLLRHLYGIIAHDEPLEMPFRDFFGGMR
ncbi:NAD(P)H-dependent glycerol-3-phosphate dehydrogenase [Pseudactinotalea sp. Z1739]|uniref:NAD(P)H-dependent glycerol-3-phosphate dehydrogenase n=1 Tax=Pseudactinotalea sp. Z1739 TaxID=3413028 RepID=UPI003C79C8CF